MLNENAKKWVAALRSGEYKQTKHKLADKNGYCCLGVACELAVKAGVIEPRYESIRDKYFHYDGAADILPGSVARWLGLADCGAHYCNGQLSADNDDGATFSQIADIIESEPEGLFVIRKEE